jgi:hypothetical protein
VAPESNGVAERPPEPAPGAPDETPDSAEGDDGAVEGVQPPGPDDVPIDAPPPPAEVALPACARTVAVTTSAALNAATAAAVAGDCIELANGNYTFQSINKKGTDAKPIVVRAKSAGKAVVTSGSLDVRGAFVVIEGLRWTSGGRFSFTDCSHCRFTRNRVAPVETADGVDWITVGGKSDACRIDHNDVGPRTRIGNDVMLAGSGKQIVQHTRIDHNFFHDVHRGGGNGWETIRAGLSGWTFSKAFTTIEQNLFQRCDGDPETISIKSSDNVIRYNTLRGNSGDLTLRHGNRTSVYGNFIFGDGVAGSSGIRVFGGDHRIWNNFISGVDGTGIFLEGGESNDTTGNLTDHKQVYRAQVVNNTIITKGTNRAIGVGGAHPKDPIDSTVANNLAQGTGPLFSLTSTSVNTRYTANIVNGSPGITRSAAEVRRVDPKLVKVGDVLKLASGSAAIDKGAASFAFVTEDIEGQPRTTPDVGADELSTAPVLNHPLTAEDVGPDAP